MIGLESVVGMGLVWLVTQGVKKVQALQLSAKRKTYIRLLVALFSFGAVLGTTVLSGGEVDPSSIEALADAFVIFLGSQGVHLLSKDTE